MNLNTKSFALVGKANKRNIACDIYAMGNWAKSCELIPSFYEAKTNFAHFYRYIQNWRWNKELEGQTRAPKTGQLYCMTMNDHVRPSEDQDRKSQWGTVVVAIVVVNHNIWTGKVWYCSNNKLCGCTECQIPCDFKKCETYK